jgi:hypothetical protein
VSAKKLNETHDFQAQLNEPGTQLNGPDSNKQEAPFNAKKKPQKDPMKSSLHLIKSNATKKDLAWSRAIRKMVLYGSDNCDGNLLENGSTCRKQRSIKIHCRV